jgi:hypothetical protein
VIAAHFVICDADVHSLFLLSPVTSVRRSGARPGSCLGAVVVATMPAAVLPFRVPDYAIKHSIDRYACQAFIRFQALTSFECILYTGVMGKDRKAISEAAAILGRIGGKIGGKIGGPRGGRARAKKLSAERRREIAREAARARWARAKKNG